MLSVDMLEASEIDRAVDIFHRDGFVAIKDALSPEQLARAQAGSERVVQEQLDATALEAANRGYARFSFGSQIHHPEWAMLIDLPTTLPIVEKILGEDLICFGGGGDYSIPGAEIQHLHSDVGEFLNDPKQKVTFQDLPTFFVVINFLMCDFEVENGAIRFIPCTHRSRGAPPSLEDEPEWMQNNHTCAPAGTAIIRDVRCWHGGTANHSDQPRVMTSIGYFAPWYNRNEVTIEKMPMSIYSGLSERAQHLSRRIVERTS